MSHQTDKDTHKRQRLEEKRREAIHQYGMAVLNHGINSDEAKRAHAEYKKFDDHLSIDSHKPK